ncbi:hypothetical protein AMYBAR_004670 [Amycolatopsis bartoniae]|uniref:Uncharacterized protein n=1 Tax=Amycolatopsis bartoniae TaxID=941986 RepID=A0A8H9M9I3_9PSEU|nr:hypothetical protein GCM10017566_13570 [Amycolatopsis bartoniae]
MLAAAPFDSGLLASGSTYLYRRAPQEVLDLVHALGEVCGDRGAEPGAVREPVPEELWPAVEKLLP